MLLIFDLKIQSMCISIIVGEIIADFSIGLGNQRKCQQRIKITWLDISTNCIFSEDTITFSKRYQHFTIIDDQGNVLHEP